MKIKIKDTEIEIKNKMRAYLIYEQLTDKTFNPKTITDLLTYFYSLILANDKSIELTFDEFLDFMDDHEDILNEFYIWAFKQSEVNKSLSKVKKKKENH